MTNHHLPFRTTNGANLQAAIKEYMERSHSDIASSVGDQVLPEIGALFFNSRREDKLKLSDSNKETFGKAWQLLYNYSSGKLQLFQSLPCLRALAIKFLLKKRRVISMNLSKYGNSLASIHEGVDFLLNKIK